MKKPIYILTAAMLLVIVSAALKVLEVSDYASLGIGIGAMVFVVQASLMAKNARENGTN